MAKIWSGLMKGILFMCVYVDDNITVCLCVYMCIMHMIFDLQTLN